MEPEGNTRELSGVFVGASQWSAAQLTVQHALQLQEPCCTASIIAIIHSITA